MNDYDDISEVEGIPSEGSVDEEEDDDYYYRRRRGYYDYDNFECKKCETNDSYGKLPRSF